MQVSLPPAPVQTRAKQVQFDPCVGVGDDLVTRVGFDPGSRERSVAEGDTGTFTTIGCQFWREASENGQYSASGLSVTSSDLNLDHYRATPDFVVLHSDPIGGHDAVTYRTPRVPNSCAASTESPDGTFTIDLSVFPAPADLTSACDEVRRITETLSTALTPS
ncbi:hypothetical protein GCM10023318_38950 [Nocardia callitridis]|uniref:DUF3558 domain-containing protein n=1 Tax=Nocardia callitridis TaxID=648753 RepID=A0ABP9KM88_9NOCA